MNDTFSWFMHVSDKWYIFMINKCYINDLQTDYKN